MNNTINSVSFCGEKEVLYCLKQAATEAHNAGMHKVMCAGPRPLSYKTQEAAISLGLCNAYMDMAVYDSSFKKTLTKISSKKIDELRQILQPINSEYVKLNPLSLFAQSMRRNLKKHDKVDIINTIDLFIQTLSNNIK